MRSFTMGQLEEMTPAVRAGLDCVKVQGQTRATLNQLTAAELGALGARLCGAKTCSTMLFAGWERSRCSSCVAYKSSSKQGTTAAEAIRDGWNEGEAAEAAVNQRTYEMERKMERRGWQRKQWEYSADFFGWTQKRWDGFRLMMGLIDPPPPSADPARCGYPSEREAEPMQVEIAGGAAATGGGITAGDAYPTPLPTFVPISVFQDAAGNLLDMSAVNTHTAVLGQTGEGKTHLTCHLIMQWAPVKGWNHGWVAAIMPRSVWDVTPSYNKLLDATQVYFIDEYRSKDDKKGLMEWIWLTVEDNRRNRVPSLLLIDDCASPLVKGELPIDFMLTNGRSQWLTVITLWQRAIKSQGDGPAIRKNQKSVIFFKSMIPTVSKVEEWVPEDQAKEFKLVTKSELGEHWAGVINTGNNSLSKIQAPSVYAITTLGRPDRRGKLITERPLATHPAEDDVQDIRARLGELGVPAKRKTRGRFAATATYGNADAGEDSGDEYQPSDEMSDTTEFESDTGEAEDRPRCENPPGCLPPWDYDAVDKVYRCKKCGWESLQKTAEGRSDRGDSPDNDPDGDGGGRKRERPPSSGDEGSGEGGHGREKATAADDRERIFVSSKYRKRVLSAVRDAVERECRAVLAVTDRVCDWITRLAIAEVKVLTYDPIAELVQKRAGLQRTVADQAQTVAEQQKKIAELEQQVSTLTAEQHRVAELEAKLAALEQRLAPGKPGRPKKEVTGYINYLVAEVMEQMQASAGGGAAGKTANETEQFVEHIAGLAAQRMQQSS